MDTQRRQMAVFHMKRIPWTCGDHSHECECRTTSFVRQDRRRRQQRWRQEYMSKSFGCKRNESGAEAGEGSPYRMPKSIYFTLFASDDVAAASSANDNGAQENVTIEFKFGIFALISSLNSYRRIRLVFHLNATEKKKMSHTQNEWEKKSSSLVREVEWKK